MFMYNARGYRHLNRNKSKRNLRTKKNYYLDHLPDIKRVKRMLPYFRRRKYLKCWHFWSTFFVWLMKQN